MKNVEPTARPLFFVHIPKSGGNSIYKIFEIKDRPITILSYIETLTDEGRDSAPIIDANHDIVGGHVYLLNLESFFKARPDLFLFTMVRDPLEHISSHIRWLDHYNLPEFEQDYRLLGLGTRRIVDEIKAVDFADPGSLDYFITNLSPVGIGLFDNMQTRFLVSSRQGYIKEWHPLSLNITSFALQSLNRMNMVGHLSYYNETADALRRLLPHFTVAEEMPRENQNIKTRNLDTSNFMIRDVLRKRILVDEWLCREVIFRIKTGFYTKNIDAQENQNEIPEPQDEAAPENAEQENIEHVDNKPNT